MENITTVVGNLVTLGGTVIDFAMNNVLLSICLVAGTVIPAGFALFRHAKHAVK